MKNRSLGRNWPKMFGVAAIVTANAAYAPLARAGDATAGPPPQLMPDNGSLLHFVSYSQSFSQPQTVPLPAALKRQPVERPTAQSMQGDDAVATTANGSATAQSAFTDWISNSAKPVAPPPVATSPVYAYVLNIAQLDRAEGRFYLFAHHIGSGAFYLRLGRAIQMTDAEANSTTVDYTNRMRSGRHHSGFGGGDHGQAQGLNGPRIAFDWRQ